VLRGDFLYIRVNLGDSEASVTDWRVAAIPLGCRASRPVLGGDVLSPGSLARTRTFSGGGSYGLGLGRFDRGLTR
jgi:hypothetical protein